MERYYLDTSIWLDYYEKRGRNGEAALKLIDKTVEENGIIGYSDLNLLELKGLGYSPMQINEIFRAAKPKNSMILHITSGQIEEAKRIAKARKVPRKDALHAILCRDYDFQLIARDMHFEKLKDVAYAKKPEEIIYGA